MWNLKYDTDKSIYERETDSQIYREQAYGCQGGEGLGEEGRGRLGLVDVSYYV